jgi:hypothetical protein
MVRSVARAFSTPLRISGKAAGLGAVPNYGINQVGVQKGGAQPIWYGDASDPKPFTIANISTVVTTNIWAGYSNAVGPNNPLESTEITLGGYASYDGSEPVYYANADGPGGAIQVLPGVTSFFLPVSLSALGGAAVFVQSTTPTGTIPVNSLWFNTVNQEMLFWNGAAWIQQQFSGSQLIVAATITASQVANGTLTTTQLAAAAGILGGQIANATITGGNIAANTIVAGNIAANTITAAQLAAGIVYAGIVNGTTINGATITASGSSGGVYKTSDATPKLRVVESPNSGSDATWAGNFGDGANNYPQGLSMSGIDDGNFFGVNLFSGSPKEQTNAFLAVTEVNHGAVNEILQCQLTGPSSGHTSGQKDLVAIGLLGGADNGTTTANLQAQYFDTSLVAHTMFGFTPQGFFSSLVNPLNFTAYQPGSSYVPETWHAISLDAGWAATGGGYAAPRYRMLPDGNMQLNGAATAVAVNGAKTLNNTTPLPSAYRPANDTDFVYLDAVGTRCHMSLATTGVITAHYNAAAGNMIAEINGTVPLN